MVLDFSMLNTRIFPGDLIGEMLSRLPVKALKRFECVSKMWKTLISDPDFIKTHLGNMAVIDDYQDFVLKTTSEECFTKLRIRDDGLQGFHAIKARSAPIPKPPGKVFLNISSHCNGLLCVRVSDRKNRLLSLMLWNPATGKHKELPPPERSMVSSDVFFGLVYDSSIDTYKVVGVPSKNHLRNKGLDHCNIRVLSLVSKSWKSVKTDARYGVFSSYQELVFTNGVLHWLALKKSFIILCFDVVRERLEEIQSPPTNMGVCGYRLYLLGGSLCVVGSQDIDLLDMDVWVLKEDGVRKSWNKSFKISLAPKKSFDSFVPICVVGNGRFLTVVDDELYLYKYLNDHSETLQPVSIPLPVGLCHAKPIVESLVSP